MFVEEVHQGVELGKVFVGEEHQGYSWEKCLWGRSIRVWGRSIRGYSQGLAGKCDFEW